MAKALAADGLTLGLAESLTGGLAASRLVNVPGASAWFRGSVCQLRVRGEVRRARRARGPGRVRGRGPGHGRRGAAGARCRRRTVGHRGGRPDRAGRPAGRAPSSWGWPDPDARPRPSGSPCPGDRARVRQYATIAALDFLRRSLDARRPERPTRPPVAAASVGVRAWSWSVVALPAARRGRWRRRCGRGGHRDALGRQLLPRVAGLQGDRACRRRRQGGRPGEARPGPRPGDGDAVAQHHQRAGAGGRHLDLVAALAVLEPRADEGGHGQDDHVGRRRLAAVEQLVGHAGSRSGGRWRWPGSTSRSRRTWRRRGCARRSPTRAPSRPAARPSR